jgi:hypothetical protein
MRFFRKAKARGARLAATALATLLVAGAAQGQPKAGVRIDTLQLIFETVTSDCIATHPELEPKLQADLYQWRSDNAMAVEQAAVSLAALPSQEKAALLAVQDMLRVQTRQHFADLALHDGTRDFCGKLMTKVVGVSQPSGTDASTYGQAVDMFYRQMKKVEVSTPECGRRLPSLASSFEAVRDTWRQREAKAIAAVESAVITFADDSLLATVEAQSTRLARASIDTAFDFESGFGKAYCQKIFDDLAAGTDRTESPKMYSFLDNGPTTD